MTGLHRTSEISRPKERSVSERGEASREKPSPRREAFTAATSVKMFAFVSVFSLQKEPEQVIATEPPPTCQDPPGDRVPSPHTKDNQPSRGSTGALGERMNLLLTSRNVTETIRCEQGRGRACEKSADMTRLSHTP